jgi:hypothetical protein
MKVQYCSPLCLILLIPGIEDAEQMGEKAFVGKLSATEA